MSQFLYLYRGGRNGNPSPEQVQQVMQKWITWLKSLADQGHIKDQGQPLEPSGKLVKGRSKTVTDGPFAEAKELVGGWALCEVRDMDEAVVWAKRFLDIVGDGESRIRPVF